MAPEARPRRGVDGRRPRPDACPRGAERRRHPGRDLRAADHAALPLGLRRARQGGADRAGRVLPPVVHAADRVLRGRGGGDRPAPSGTEVRRADVRADPQQPLCDRHVRRLRAAGRGRNDLRREHHVRREDRPGGRDHVRRRRDDAGAVAVASEPRVPLASPLRLEPPRGAAPGQARPVGGRLRRGEPDRLHRHHRVHRQDSPTATRSTRARSSCSSSRTRSSPCRSSPRSCRRCPDDGRPATSTGCARCSRAACATRSSSSCPRRSATWRSPCPSSACCCSTGAPTRTTPSTSRARCRRSPWVCRSSPRSNC